MDDRRDQIQRADTKGEVDVSAKAELQVLMEDIKAQKRIDATVALRADMLEQVARHTPFKGETWLLPNADREAVEDARARRERASTERSYPTSREDDDEFWDATSDEHERPHAETVDVAIEDPSDSKSSEG